MFEINQFDSGVGFLVAADRMSCAAGDVARASRQPRDYAAHAASPTREQTIPD